MNRRAFFGLGTKVVGAVTLGAHIALDKIGAQPVQPSEEAAELWPSSSKPIIDWSASYDDYVSDHDFYRRKLVSAPMVRMMSLPRGVYPPATTTWNGVPYSRYYVSPLGRSVLYRRG